SYIAPANHYSMLSEYAGKLATVTPEEKERGFVLLKESFESIPVKAEVTPEQSIPVRNLTEKLITESDSLNNFIALDINSSENYFNDLSARLNMFSGIYR